MLHERADDLIEIERLGVHGAHEITAGHPASHLPERAEKLQAFAMERIGCDVLLRQGQHAADKMPGELAGPLGDLGVDAGGLVIATAGVDQGQAAWRSRRPASRALPEPGRRAAVAASYSSSAWVLNRSSTSYPSSVYGTMAGVGCSSSRSGLRPVAGWTGAGL